MTTREPVPLPSELPEFAAEHAANASQARELGELFSSFVSALVPPASLASESASAVSRGRARLLAAVSESSERFSPLFGKLGEFFDLDAPALRAVFERAELASEWQVGPLPWVSLFHLDGGPAVAGLDVGFVRLEKGMPFPRHRHRGPERVMILKGGYHDNDGTWYGPGDFHLMAEGTEHSLQMSAEEDVLLAIILSQDIEVVGP